MTVEEAKALLEKHHVTLDGPGRWECNEPEHNTPEAKAEKKAALAVLGIAV